MSNKSMTAADLADRLEAIPWSDMTGEDQNFMHTAVRQLRAMTDWTRTWTLGDAADMDTPMGWRGRALNAEQELETRRLQSKGGRKCLRCGAGSEWLDG